MEPVRLLESLIGLGGSDLHFQAGAPPMVRLSGDLKALDSPALSDARVREYMRQMSPPPALAGLRMAEAVTAGRMRVCPNPFLGH